MDALKCPPTALPPLPKRRRCAPLIEQAARAHYTNAVVRINGQNEVHEADWIKHLKISE